MLEMVREPRGVRFKLWVITSRSCFRHSPRSHIGDVCFVEFWIRLTSQIVTLLWVSFFGFSGKCVFVQNMYIYTCIYMYVYIYICIHIYTHINIYIWMYIFRHIYVYMYMKHTQTRNYTSLNHSRSLRALSPSFSPFVPLFLSPCTCVRMFVRVCTAKGTHTHLCVLFVCHWMYCSCNGKGGGTVLA